MPSMAWPRTGPTKGGQQGLRGRVCRRREYDAKIAVLRQLLAWERDLAGAVPNRGLFEDRIYVLTPDAAVIELSQGSTPVDFAYAVHTSVGHRCRGARVDGAMVPLNTPAAKRPDGGDHHRQGRGPRATGSMPIWATSPATGPRPRYAPGSTPRPRMKPWPVAAGRGKLLQREGKTAMKLDDLATQLGFKSADALFEVVGRDEFSLRNIENLLRPPEPVLQPDEYLLLKKTRPMNLRPKAGCWWWVSIH